jgi:D-threo-aldose 1-dehydrogenase
LLPVNLSIDIAFVHDISSDNKYLPTPWPEQFEIARKGAFPKLTRMREEGLIKGWGIGVNTPEPIVRLLEVADPDVCLLASQYSLIDHKNALNQVFLAAREKNVSFVIGSSLNAGFLSGSSRYNYGKENYKVPPSFIEKRRKLLEVAANHGVDLRTAALQFSATPDVASALVVGCRNEQQILADYTSMQTKIPDECWATSPDPIRHRPLTCYPKLRCRYGPTYASQGCNKVKDPEIWNDGHETKTATRRRCPQSSACSG